ncbi:hypothetical protein AURDEDRAFT_178206 [Auricularia subglabra TFB-10046 SS5]|uniref:Reverse transcriptase domain-containing protein n=1 Tax=Auricularia subglabra (strain TFB-10046 / SS5) TaxID=717982 RepID=J0D256_AURST|nr:hypothetical protein AURDEDRAFT_178206 [Auricularia subglabra TFB-10046 SS5]
MRYRLQIDDRLSAEMVSDIGILMGDPGSPLAFLLYISDFTTIDHPDDVILSGSRVSHLEHADDIAIFSTSEAGLQLKLNELAAWASLNQMQVNLKKTVAMVFRRTNALSNAPRPTLRLNGELLTVVKRQQYVGVMFASVGLPKHVGCTLRPLRTTRTRGSKQNILCRVPHRLSAAMGGSDALPGTD